MDNKETITQGLGIEDSWFDSKVDSIVKIWKEEEKVSAALEAVAQEIKDDEFGTGIELSAYEKKLILAGYVAGQAAIMAENHAKEKLKRLEMLVKLLGGKGGEGLEGLDFDEEN